MRPCGVDVEIDGQRVRWGGTVTASDEPLPDSGDPTSELLRRARDAMFHLADLYGEVRIEGVDVTRWEFHASPRRIELDDEANFSAYAPDLPGVVATGATEAECEREMRDAIALHLEGLRDSGHTIPEPSHLTATYV